MTEGQQSDRAGHDSKPAWVHEEFGAAVVAEARDCIGTPFAWQQAAKGRGADCKGLLVIIARELGRPEADSLEAQMAGEYLNRIPTGELRRGLARLFDRAEQARPGDILLMRIAGKAQHLAIYCGDGRMIHTYAKGPERVIEVPMGKTWWAALDSVWTWRL